VASGSGADQNKFKVAEIGGKMVFSGQFINYPQTNDKTISFGYALEGGFSIASLKVMTVDLGNLAGYTAGTDFLIGANFNPSDGFHSLDFSVGLNNSYQIIFGQKKLTRSFAFNIPKPVITRALSTENIARGIAPFFSSSSPKMDFQIGKDYFLNSISSMFNYATGSLDSVKNHIVIETSEADQNTIQIDASAKIDGALVFGGGLELGVTLSYSDEFSKPMNQYTIVNGKLLSLANYNSSSNSSLFSLKDEVVFLLKNAPLLVLDLINALITKIGEAIESGVDFTLKTLDGACEFGGNIAGDIGSGFAEIASYAPTLPFMNSSLKSTFCDQKIIDGYMSQKVKTASEERSKIDSGTDKTLYLISKCYRINVSNSNKEIIQVFDPCRLTIAIDPHMFQQYRFEESDKNNAGIFYYDYATLTWSEIPGDMNQDPDTVSTEVSKSGTYAVGILYSPGADRKAPEIQGHYPVNGGIYDPDSLIWAKLYEPTLGIGIDLANSSLKIDGSVVDALWDPVRNKLFFKPKTILPLGIHTLEIIASDYNNNKQTEFVQFTVNRISDVKFVTTGETVDISCYPNPMNQSLSVEIRNCKYGNYDIGIYNFLGQKIKLLFNGKITGSDQRLVWDRTNNRGQVVASGPYFIRIKNDENIVVKKIVVQ
jgi:hypothetical protein